MTTSRMKPLVSIAALGALSAFVGWLFWNTPGADTPFWFEWLKNVAEYGPLAAYTASQEGYPPGAFWLFWILGNVCRDCPIDPLGRIKAMLVLFLAISSIVVLLASRRFSFAAGTLASLAISAVQLMYLDVLFAPFVFGAIWAAAKGRPMLMTALFGAAVFFKLQPLIVAPFVVVYLLARRGIVPDSAWRREIVSVSLVACLFVVLTLTVHGSPVGRALSRAVRHSGLSQQAANIPWLFGGLLTALVPGGPRSGMENGLILIVDAPVWFLLLWRAAFGVVFLLLLFRYWKSDDSSVVGLLQFSLLGYLAYFMLCTGVHENHLFLAGLLSLALAWLQPSHRWMAILVCVSANLNLIAFYGWTSDSARQPVFGIDPTICLSLANVVLCGVIGRAVLGRARAVTIDSSSANMNELGVVRQVRGGVASHAPGLRDR